MGEMAASTVKCNPNSRLWFRCLIGPNIRKDEETWAIALRCVVSWTAVLTLGNFQTTGLALRRHGKNSLNSVSQFIYTHHPQVILQYRASHERVAWPDTQAPFAQ